MSVLISQEFDQPLFAVAFHPSSNEYVVGFVDGTVTAYTYDTKERLSTQAWTTKRHKDSCRAIGYDQTGKYVYTAGSDKVLKKANAKTGKVVAKNKQLEDVPTVMSINENFVIIGTENGSVLYYNPDNLKLAHSMKDIHEDSISSIVHVPGKSKYQVAVSSGSVVNTVDVRKEKVVLASDDQEDELTSGCLASEELSVFGTAQGILTIWRNHHLQDQVNRVRLSDDSVDCVIAGEDENIVYAGCSDGCVYEVDIKTGKKLHTFEHDDIEEVTLIELDYEYRLVSGSMESLKIWSIEGDIVEEEEEGSKKKSKKSKKDKKNSAAQSSKKRKTVVDERMGHNGVASFADL